MNSLVLNSSLFFLGVLDLCLALWVFLRPGRFYEFFFAVQPDDSRGLLYRTGGIWLTFSLLQFLALVTWRAYPAVLLLIVGVRLSEWCADWVLLLFGSNFSVPGTIGFFISPIFTVFFASLFLRGFYWTQGFRDTAGFVLFFEPSILLLNGLLVCLVVFDLLLGLGALRNPRRWFGWISPATHPDPANLWARTGGIWLGFAIVQLVVLLSWVECALGLLIVAGMRLTETLADWFFAAVTSEPRITGTVILLAILPVNVLLAVVFCQGYLTFTV